MLGTNLPSPLYELYRQQWNFSTVTLTLIFAIYVFFLIPSLLIFGRISDFLGRKPVLLLGLSLALSSSILFILAKNIFWLFLARSIQGIAVGIISGTATAALSEIQANKAKAALVTSTTAAGGGALGPIVSGILAQYSPWPTTLPFVVHISLIVPAILGILLTPETVKRQKVKLFSILYFNLNIPSKIRHLFAISSATAFVAWSIAALFMALVPSYLSTLLNIKNSAIGGSVVFAFLLTSLISQIIYRKAKFPELIPTGLFMLILCLISLIISVPLNSFYPFMFGTFVGGIGLGLAFLGSMVLVNEVAPTKKRGEVISAFYSILYLGVGLPIIGVGLLSQFIGLYLSILFFSLVSGFLALGIIYLFVFKSNVIMPNQSEQ